MILLACIVVAICVLGEAFFAAAELSIISANQIRLEEEGGPAAQRVIWFRNNPERLFGTTLLGTNGCTVTGTTVATLTLMKLDPANGAWFALLLMSPLILIGGEIVPKSVAQARATQVAKLLSAPLALVHRLLSPPIWLIRSYTGLLYRALGIGEDRRVALVSREELVLLATADATEGAMEDDERVMIARIFQFSHLCARDSMVPLAEMVAIEDEATVRDAAGMMAREGFSRLPVFHERIDEVVGVLHHLDVLKGARASQPVSELMRPPHFVPETQEIDDILIILQRESASVAIVVDEFGGAVGLLTLEDLLEEIVGEIEDEHDPQSGRWRSAPDGGYLVSARTPVDELNEAFGLALPDGDYETIAGYVLASLRRIPRIGEILELPGGGRLQVRRANERAILEVHLQGVRPQATKTPKP